MSQQARDYGDRETTDEALCAALDDDLRETIAALSESRGQTTAGVVKAAVSELETRYEGRIIEFDDAFHARAYYQTHRRQQLEYDGAYDDLSPDDYYGTPAQPLHELLKGKAAVAKEKWRAAARWLDTNDPETRVVVNEHGSPEEIPALDADLEIQHGTEGEADA